MPALSQLLYYQSTATTATTATKYLARYTTTASSLADWPTCPNALANCSSPPNPSLARHVVSHYRHSSIGWLSAAASKLQVAKPSHNSHADSTCRHHARTQATPLSSAQSQKRQGPCCQPEQQQGREASCMTTTGTAPALLSALLLAMGHQTPTPPAKDP